jgi:hypothetical protein
LVSNEVVNSLVRFSYLLLFAGLFASAATSAQERLGSVAGKVLDETGTPVSDAYVAAYATGALPLLRIPTPTKTVDLR